jgi:hypothetical protein
MRVGVIRTGGQLSVREYSGAIEPRLDIAALPDSPADTFGVALSATRAELGQEDVDRNSHARLRTRAMGIKIPPPLLPATSPAGSSKQHRTNLESQLDLFSAESALYSSMPAPQQSTIAATHERQTSLDQANSAIAEIIGLPAPFRNSVGPKQPFR